MEVVNKTLVPQSTEEIGQFLEEVLIQKYGSYEKAKEVMSNLRLSYPDDADFEKQINKELHFDKLVKIIDTLKGIDSLPKLVKFKDDIESGKINLGFSKQEILELSDFLESVKSVFQFTSEPLFAESFSEKVRFTIKEIRDEIGINQRTFTKWLNLFFDTKYNGHRSVSLIEYIEIFQKLMLKEDEYKFDFVFDNHKYLKRINDGLVFSKEKLTRLTESDYKTLQQNCESYIKEYKNLDVYPFSIASKILEKMG